MTDKFTRLSDQLQQMARQGADSEQLLETLQSVEDYSALLEFDDFDGRIGTALATRAEQLGAPKEDCAFLAAKGHFFEGNMMKAAELLEPIADGTEDVRLLHLWAQVPRTPEERASRLLTVVARVGDNRKTWELIRFNADRAGMEDLHRRAVETLASGE